jgi:putative aldouronate transport system substrate-binding protein
MRMTRVIGLILCLIVTGVAFGGGTQQVADEESRQTTMKLWVQRTADQIITGETWALNQQDILDRTGVLIELEYFDWGDTYRQKMNMYAAAGNLPSGVWLMSEVVKDPFQKSVIDSMGEAGLLYDLNPYVNDTENYPRLTANLPAQFQEMATNRNTGELYVYPSHIHWEFPHAPGGITIRQDWLDELGMEYPETVDELYDVIVAFKENFTDEAGNPTIPVSLCGFDPDQPVERYVWQFWLNNWMGTTKWYEHDGRYDYAWYTKMEELTEALLFLNRLWREDLFDKEAFSQTDEQFVEKCVNGAIGVHSYSYVNTYKASDTLMQQEPRGTKRFVAIPPIVALPDMYSLDDINIVEIFAVPMSGWIVTRDGITESDVADYMKAVNYIGTYEGAVRNYIGIEGRQWEYNDAGEIVYTEDYLSKRDSIPNYNAIEGIGAVGWMSSHKDVTSRMLQLVVTKPDVVQSVENLRGFQTAKLEPINSVIAGEIELSKGPLIENAYKQMVIQAISADSAAECRAIVAAWPAQRDALGYQAWVEERTEAVYDLFGTRPGE